MDQIESKIKSGLRLSFSDGVCLLREFELHRLGGLADSIRRELHGRNAYYVVNAHINPTNICKVRCPLCAYAVDGSDSRAFELSVGEILRRAESAVSRGVMQLHLVSSIHPDKSFGWYCDIISAIHSAFPRVHIKAYTA
ncbi:MAG: aminofutalosine synthase MqnE, partial [Planctomycetaceae bacterium]|nr:aminofutalosine synthase MqnE [Planctomycetaceae bacterium]